jgi:phage terminase large subunit
VSAIAIDRATDGVQLYGPARDFWRYKGTEAILSGPYETGKTFATLHKLHALCVKYPGSQAFVMRQTYKSLVNTAIVTYENKILPVHPDDTGSAIRKYGGSRPEFYLYPNGSKILCGGLDNPDKILSGEFDFGYVNQAEEISLDAWEKLSTRCSGRAGNAPYTQLFADCNPGPPTHWILHRQRLKVFTQLHQHNPTLYDQGTGELTPQGVKTMDVLSGLTGLRKKRGLLGLWVAAEGVVYEDYDKTVHVIPSDKCPPFRNRYMSIDFGYTNPFVAQWWGEDHDGRLYLYREIYMSQRTVRVHCDTIKRLECGASPQEWVGLSQHQKDQRWRQNGERITYRVADHDAEDRATLDENGISTIAAKKEISVGIEKVQDRLKVQPDGKSRLCIVEDACMEYDPELYREYPGDLHPCCTEHEFPVYTWPEQKEDKVNKEVPVDLNNHGMDAARYIVMERDVAGMGVQVQKAPGLYRTPARPKRRGPLS